MLRFNFKISLLYIAFIFLSHSSHAQKKTGNYTNLAGRTGEIEASIKVIEGDTIFNGPFKFVIKNDLKEGHRFVKETYLGKYLNGFKEGKWEYDKLDLNYSVIDIEDEKIKMIYWGKKEVMDASYKKGIPEGLWSYAFFHLDSNSNKKIERIGSIHFQDGKPKGSFAFKSLKAPQYELEGEFDKIGRLDKKWTLNYYDDTLQIVEERNYDDGFLLNIKKTNKNTGKTIDSLVFEEVINKISLNQIPKAEGNFDVLFDDGFLLESPQLDLQKQGNDLLKNAYEVFLWADLGRGSLVGAIHDFNPGTGRFEYDLPDFFLKDMDEMRVNLNEIITRSEGLLHDPKFKINSHQSEILAKSEVILEYELEKSKGILDLINSRADSLYKHIDRDVYFRQIYHKYIDPVDTLSYNFDGREIQFALHEHVEKDLSPFYKLEDAVAVLNQRSEAAIVDVKNEFEKIIQVQRLGALEEDMNFTSEKLKKSYTEVPNSLSSNIYRKSIENWSDTKWQQYTNIEGMKPRELEGRFILGVMEELIQAKPKIDSIEWRVKKIDSAYTELVFDPYTYSQNIKKRIKKRVYDEIATKYFNHLKDELINNSHSDEIPEKVIYLERLQNKLLELSKQNTKSLEKKLRKSNDFESIKKWLELDT